MDIPFPSGRPLGILAAIAVAAGACDNPLALSPARFDNTTDTTVIYALRGTDIALPSGFDMSRDQPARTDRAEPFDFAFDIEDSGRAVLLSADILGVVTGAGILVVDDSFEGVTSAPLDGYVVDSVVVVTQGTVFVARSRGISCSLLGTLPLYGKFRVLGIDPLLRALTIEKLVDINCGYRGLEPGLPSS
ncbi:MAG TPA: hypothetical protein VGA37_15050 [Gemmatimonadales bacterium]